MSVLETLQIPEPIIQGNTWNGAQMELKDLDTNEPINLTDAQVNLQLKLTSTNTDSKKFSTSPQEGDYPITIVDPANGKFNLDAIQNIDMALGTHEGILNITFPGNNLYSYCVVTMTIRNR